MIYLASPYSHTLANIREARYEAALAIVAKYAQEGVVVYSPIVHWHVVAQRFELPGDASFWEAQNKAMLIRSTKLVVLALDGWNISPGIAQEMLWADAIKIPTTFIKPDRPA